MLKEILAVCWQDSSSYEFVFLFFCLITFPSVISAISHTLHHHYHPPHQLYAHLPPPPTHQYQDKLEEGGVSDEEQWFWGGVLLTNCTALHRSHHSSSGLVYENTVLYRSL